MIKLVATDFDGTLYSPRHPVSDRNRKTLEWLGVKGICRVLVTGRNLYSALKRLDENFPIDYLIFSNGAGLMEWRGKKLLRRAMLAPEDTAQIADCLLAAGVDLMLHMPIPLNHYFFYHTFASQPKGDLKNRIEIYRPFTAPWKDLQSTAVYATQFLAVYQPEDESYLNLNGPLANYMVIRTTSVLDGISTWMEIFPGGVNKASALADLAQMLGWRPENVLVLGNDYNDLQMLEWCPNARVVDNAPDNLKARFPGTVACGQSPLWEVCKEFFRELEQIHHG